MTTSRHFSAVLVCFFFLSLGAATGVASDPPAENTRPSAVEEGSCGQLAVLLEAQNQELTRDLRRLHREVAALREELAQPGLKEAFSGIGYILGLFGVAFFFMGKNRNTRG